jgi:hypothetical protein
VEATNSPVETSLKISHRDGLHIARTFVSVRRWLPVRMMNVSNQNHVLAEPTTLDLCASPRFGASISKELCPKIQEMISDARANRKSENPGTLRS